VNLDSFIGVPYSGHKFCRQFAADVLAAHGIPMPMVDRPRSAGGWVRVERPEPLDVVVFARGRAPDHVGVCIGRGRFLHCEEGSTSRIEYLGSPLWASRVEGFYRYEGENGRDSA
jgi:cell wall-associated NlpC family hydrolase